MAAQSTDYSDWLWCWAIGGGNWQFGWRSQDDQDSIAAIQRALDLERNIGVIVYSPMQSGLLTGAMTKERIANLPDNDWRKTSTEFQEPRLSRNLNLVELLRQIGQRHGRSPAEVAIAWTLRHPAVTAAIMGGRNAKQVDGIIGAAEFRLREAELDEINTFLHQNP
ncbi:aldo/keto reductase [Leptolyngbya sp. 7M]|uniref:aldo/keto reductase n=1 Tax=Leptolyngbya sp. 7M TaxID=2812896 RepID=UPI001B8DA999|nr:aldo/keto reductase [Leptolyngbya sp. 7M]QYO63502.1 aldo/keto reductase [Leptolyngbya sp. 7M]